MIDRHNFKNFIDNSVAAYTNLNSNTHDLHVDAYANFIVRFEDLQTKFSNGKNIRNYGGGLGNILFDDPKLYRFIKTINDIELNINAKTLDIPGASYAIHRLMPMNSTPHIQMVWLNTREPFIENIFVPWMKDNTLYGVWPLVKCNLSIQFPMLKNNANIIYRYYGVRPIEVGLHKMTNEPVNEFYRKVAFDFDYFLVTNLE